MLGKLFLCFMIVPLVELALLIKLSQFIGIWQTILFQIAISFLGASLVKLQGMMVWVNVQTALREGRLPTEELLDGLLVFAAGLLLLTPGILTDSVGFLILFPATRYPFKLWLRKKLSFMAKEGRSNIFLFFR